MTEPFKIVIAGEAAPFRKKVATWNARDGRSGTHAYDEKKYAGWKDVAQYTAAKEWGERTPLDCAVDFTVRVYFAIPASFSHRKQLLANQGILRPTITPDYDNLAKACADAISRIVIRDDKFIVNAHISKWYSARPRVEIEVSPTEVLEPGPGPQLSLGETA